MAIVNQIRDIIDEFESTRGGSVEEINGRVASRIKDVAQRNLFGMDINPFLVRTTQMNLVMHGDGSANVYQGDSLSSPGEWEDDQARQSIRPGSFDLCITNPPFGGSAIVDDPHTLSQYQLPAFNITNPRVAMPAEQLFVEAALKYVKPGGILAIVLPDSILNNPSLKFIRQWILMQARLIASIDLPKETFAEGGGVPNPSVLLLQRLSTSEVQRAQTNGMGSYGIFMAIPKTVGRDKRGNPVYLRTPEGFEILDSSGRPTLDDQLPLVASAFEQWKQVKEIYANTI